MAGQIRQGIENVCIGVLFTFTFIALSVGIVLNFRPLYDWNITRLGLAGTYGLTEAQIRNNYDTLIDYNSPFSIKPLQFPDLPSSEEALIHFVEVKNIFMGVYLLGVVSLLLLIFLIALKKQRRESFVYLRTASLTTLLLPCIVGIAIAFRFDDAFVLFHKMFFNNDYWIFDAAADPIILLLPDTFFLQCAAGIVLLIVLGSLALLLSYLLLSRRAKFLSKDCETFLS